MDDHELQEELEALAGNAYNPVAAAAAAADDDDDDSKAEPIAHTMARWQKLFHIPPDQVVDRIMTHRNDLTRTRVSDAHWAVVAPDKEAAGYDREAYEYELATQKRTAQLPTLLPASEDEIGTLAYLVELAGPLATPEIVQSAGAMDAVPVTVRGTSAEDGRQVWLCCVDAQAQAALLRWCSVEGAGYEPTILVDPRSVRMR